MFHIWAKQNYMKKLYFLSAFLLGFAAQAQVSISTTSSAYCAQEGCSQLDALVSNIPNQTSGYSVNSIPFSMTFPSVVSGPGINILPYQWGDMWSQPLALPFNFSFYGTLYNTLMVGENGAITFDIVNQSPVIGGCPWAYNTTIPNADFPIKNAIFGVYQDSDNRMPPVVNPTVQNVNYYIIDTGANVAPNRVLVVNFNELPQFQCENSVGLQTSQIVLHETTNIIEVFVTKRTPCAVWNGGRGLIGLIDASGTQAVTPPGRNTGTWSATNEAWKFTPSGSPVPAVVTWSANGVPFSTENPVIVCPDVTTTYTASLTSDNNLLAQSQEMLVSPIQSGLSMPMDLQICGGPVYTVDLTQNTAVVLGANPNEYQISFHNDLPAAISGEQAIGTPFAYSFTENQTIYMRILDTETTGCYFIRPFEIEGIVAPLPPTGPAVQPFTPGQTLASLVVDGQNVQWYNHPTAGNLLPVTTQLTDNTTYYASQSVSGCESRMLPQRLAVTVSSTLGNVSFTTANVTLFPNPAGNILTVSFPEMIAKTEVFNTLGQLVLSSAANGRETAIDVSALSRGHYFVKVYAADRQVVSKFIKK